jgi:hypothetical protein
VELFGLFYDEEVFESLVSETTRYASYINQPAPQFEPGELKCFIGIFLLSGYNMVPGKKLYWDTKDDVHNVDEERSIYSNYEGSSRTRQ